MKTQALLEKLVLDYENKKDEALFDEIEQDLKEPRSKPTNKESFYRCFVYNAK